MTLLLLGLAAFVLVAHSAYRSLSRQQSEKAAAPAPLTKGMTMPDDFSLETIDAKKSSLSDYRGKVVLINFWAGWCGPCLHEMPGLYELQKRLGPKGFVVLAMNMDEDPRSGMLTLRKAAGDPPFPVFHGMGSPIADRFLLEGLPFTVVLDKSFKIAYARAGERDWSATYARELLEGLL